MKAEMDGMNAELVGYLTGKGLHISTAESCTGGLLSALITEVPGSSAVLDEAVVTYSNEAKMRELGVRAETLERYGAVSGRTARQMAEGICARTGAEIGVGITGIAGPGGGSEKKPVGTVYAGISVNGATSVYHLRIGGTRNEVREETCRFVFGRLLELVRENEK